jgi:predicted nucleotidyltransferase
LQYVFGIFKFEGERMNRITDKAVKKWIDSFLEMVNKKYSPEKILIFGSRARGDYLIDRDVDMKIFK